MLKLTLYSSKPRLSGIASPFQSVDRNIHDTLSTIFFNSLSRSCDPYWIINWASIIMQSWHTKPKLLKGILWVLEPVILEHLIIVVWVYLWYASGQHSNAQLNTNHLEGDNTSKSEIDSSSKNHRFLLRADSISSETLCLSAFSKFDSSFSSSSDENSTGSFSFRDV